jgi:6-bladed beta-propeller
MTADRFCYRLAVRDVWLVIAYLTAAGCGGDGVDGGQVSVDTLESGTIVVRNGTEGVWGPGEAWRAVEVTRIGSEDAADPVVLFGDVWDVTLDALGRIYVLDRQPKEVRVFARTGEHVRTLGREGQGPGEFMNPIGLAWGPDGNLWVVDTRNARYSVFDTAGNYLDSYPRKIGSWGYGWGGGFDKAGHLYEPSYISDPATGEPRPVYISHTVGEGIAANDTFELPYYDAAGSSHRIEMQGGGYAFVGVPFAPQLTWRFDGSDGIWFGVNDAYRLYHRTLIGDTTRMVERQYDPVPVSDADREAVRERFTRYGEQATNAIIARMPDVKPAFESFVLDERGYLWITPTPPTEQDTSFRGFDVFDPEGRYLGAVEVDVDAYPRPRIIGGHLVGVARDEFDTPYVVLYRIEGRQRA